MGNLVETVDPDGHTITYSYDADNRETGETWVNPEGGTPLDVFTTAYDAAGNVTSIGDDNSSYAYTYDTDNRLASDTADYTVASDVPEVTLTYAYDGVGNTTSLSDSLGGVISYYYNDQNQVTRVSQSGSGEDPESIDFTYDHAGNMTGQTDNSDPYGEDEVLSTSYTYDNANNLTGISDQLPDSTVVASYAYTLDAADRLTAETRTWADGSSSDTTDYTYTANNQLTGVTHSNSSFANESFSYDANGNRTMTGDSTGTGNELTSDGTYDYTYDNDGNLITQTDIATGDETIYSYDFRNRLVEVQQVVGGVESVVAQYTYDALNRRIGVSEGGATTWTLYDGTSTDPLIDFNGSGDVTARYLNGPSPAGVDAVLARDTPSGGVAWYLADRLGSVGDIVDNSGTVIDHIDYTAFGTPTQSNPSEGDRFGFAGMQYDAVIGQYYDQARWYDPGVGRFIGIDPSGIGISNMNSYGYCSNDPINYFDPNGHQQMDPVRLPVINPPKTVVLYGPLVPQSQGAAKIAFCVTEQVPLGQYIGFNGLNDLKNKVKELTAGGYYVILWTHGRPGSILVGVGKDNKIQEEVNLKNPANNQILADILKSLKPKQLNFWGCNVMGKAGEPLSPEGNSLLWWFKNQLGGVPVFGPQGQTLWSNTGGPGIEPGGTPAVPPVPPSPKPE